MRDLLISTGHIVDGTGNPWYCGDIGVKDGSIAAIGRIHGKAERVIDAESLYVSPGFIDVHCHSDFTVLDPNNPRDFKIRQGITTEVARCAARLHGLHDGRQRLHHAETDLIGRADARLPLESRRPTQIRRTSAADPKLALMVLSTDLARHIAL